MTVFAKSVTYGLEDRIRLLQNHINNKLTWLGTNNIYGLIYRTLDNQGRVIPEAYIGSGINQKEYSQVFVNDKVTSTIGFIEVGDRTLGNPSTANIDMYVTMQLDKAFNDNARSDEKAVLQMEQILYGFNGFRAINPNPTCRFGISNVFTGFYTENIRRNDMHPWFVFAINFNIQYTNSICL